MKKIIANNQGSAAVIACVLTLCLLLIFTAGSEYLRLQLMARGVRDAVQSAIIAVAVENYDEVYNGLREGYSGAYRLDSQGDWYQNVDEGAVMEELNALLGLRNGRKYSQAQIEYQLSNLQVTVENTSFALENPIERFQACATWTMTVPLGFGWEHLPPLNIDMQVQAGYSPKF